MATGYCTGDLCGLMHEKKGCETTFPSQMYHSYVNIKDSQSPMSLRGIAVGHQWVSQIKWGAF